MPSPIKLFNTPTLIHRAQIQYRCLVMSEAYIRAHYHDIKTYASSIEHRVDDEDCTLESLIRDNAEVLEQCRKYD